MILLVFHHGNHNSLTTKYDRNIQLCRAATSKEDPFPSVEASETEIKPQLS